MKRFVRLLALLGLHSLAQAQPPAGAQPPFEYQLWSADHVVLAMTTKAGDRLIYRLQRVLKGDASKLLLLPGETLDVDDATWRLLGRRAAPGDGVLLLLNGPRAVAPRHGLVEFYVLGSGARFTLAPEDPSVQRTLTLSEVERLLRSVPFDTRACGRVTVRGEYVLCVEILHGGTRSEGRIGRLYRYGSEVKGERRGQIIDTAPAGGGTKFIYLGEARPHLWSVTGWDLESNPRPPGM